jgi:hypothetical protein
MAEIKPTLHVDLTEVYAPKEGLRLRGGFVVESWWLPGVLGAARRTADDRLVHDVRTPGGVARLIPLQSCSPTTVRIFAADDGPVPWVLRVVLLGTRRLSTVADGFDVEDGSHVSRVAAYEAYLRVLSTAPFCPPAVARARQEWADEMRGALEAGDPVAVLREPAMRRRRFGWVEGTDGWRRDWEDHAATVEALAGMQPAVIEA